MKLHKRFSSISDKFEVIAFHTGYVHSLSELDEALSQNELVQRFWEKPQLPFPVLLDAPAGDGTGLYDQYGLTAKSWEIPGWPTIALVAPDGRMCREASIDKFEEILADLDS